MVAGFDFHDLRLDACDWKGFPYDKLAKQVYIDHCFLVITCFALQAITFEPSPLQDFCVADLSSLARVNGLACLDPKLVQANHFSFSGLHVPGNTSNPFCSRVTPVFVSQVPELNTLGISLARIDCAPSVLVPPYMHHRATEALTVLQVSL
ncbi:Germin-like protein 1 [Melia azedarach]|uniref:Germin-like protein 1 n=1 Tax=Melia azedarach TaxID=155640 RepID=A0ACC1WUX2_MELAZ|nr:Germin-like protein 1 [Melia azedarach]